MVHLPPYPGEFANSQSWSVSRVIARFRFKSLPLPPAIHERPSIEIQRLPARTAALGTAETGIPAMGALVPLFLLFDKSLGTEFAPGRDSPKNYLLAHGNREILDDRAWELVALMAALEAFIRNTRLDPACRAVNERAVRKAPFARNLFGFHAVHSAKPLLEFFIPVAMGDHNAADSAIQPARSEQFLADHNNLLS
jgi:hypothetical protein